MHAPPAKDGAMDLAGPLMGARWPFDHLGDLTIVDVQRVPGEESGRHATTPRDRDAGADRSRPASTEVLMNRARPPGLRRGGGGS